MTEAFHIKEYKNMQKTNGGDDFINKSRLHHTWIYDGRGSK